MEVVHNFSFFCTETNEGNGEVGDGDENVFGFNQTKSLEAG